MSLFRGYILPLNKDEFTFDLDNFENNYILVNIIPEYCELKFTSGDKYLKKFEIKLALEIIQVKEAKSWDIIMNDKNKKSKNTIITVSARKKKELNYDPFNYLFNGNPNMEYIKKESQYNKFKTHILTFYKLSFDKEITGDIIINQFKKYLNDLIFNSNASDDNSNTIDNNDNNSSYAIKIPDIIPINQNCFLVECIEYNNNLINLRQIENDIKIYKINDTNYNDNKENNNININNNSNKRQRNSKYKLFEETDNSYNSGSMGLTRFIYNCLGTNLIENDTLQKNLIESFVCNIIVEYLFNNKEINTSISSESIENDVFDCLYIDKNGFLFLIKDNNHYLSTENSIINNKFRLNDELLNLLTDNDISSDSFQYYSNLIIYYICEIKKYYNIFENYINVFTNADSIRSLNWSNKVKDWIIYSLQERFFWNKTDNDINNKLKKDINDINMKKNQTISKFKIFIDSFRGKIQKNKFG